VTARFADGTSRETQCDVPRSEPIELRQRRTGTVRLRLEAVTGAPLVQREVEVLTWVGTDPAPAEPSAFAARGWRSAVATTDAAGEAVLRAMAGEVVARFTDGLEPALPALQRASLAAGGEVTITLRAAR